MKRYFKFLPVFFLAAMLCSCDADQLKETAAPEPQGETEIEYVDAESAATIAEQFLAGNFSEFSSTRAAAIQLVYTASDPAHVIGTETRSGEKEYAPFYHVFTLGDEGFIIVSGDEAARAVLGYSFSSSFDVNDIPVNMEDILNRYCSEISWRRNSGVRITEEMRACREKEISGAAETRAFSGSVAPLLGTIAWDQEPYYNAYCPKGTPVGCVATATSQIMRYWEYPSSGTGIYTSTEKYNGSTMSFNYNYTLNWSNMPKETLRKANDDIAKFCYGVGVGINMEYTTSGSGAYQSDVIRLLTVNYKYPATIKRYVREASSNRYNYTKAEWESIIKAELDAGRPVQYAGYYYNGRSYSGGHSFVCDGYNSNGYFHFNWGWGGVSNGYFSVDALQPSALGTGAGAGNFNSLQEILTGIQPPSSGNDPDPGITPEPEPEPVIVYPDSHSKNCSKMYINSVSIGSMSNTSGGSNYTYFSDKNVNAASGSNLAVSLIPGFGSSIFTVYWCIWIDYNLDGQFSNSERVFYSSGKGKVTGSVRLPSLSAGTYRIRVSMKFGRYASPTETMNYGEVEDYNLVIQ